MSFSVMIIVKDILISWILSNKSLLKVSLKTKKGKTDFAVANVMILLLPSSVTIKTKIKMKIKFVKVVGL